MVKLFKRVFKLGKNQDMRDGFSSIDKASDNTNSKCPSQQTSFTSEDCMSCIENSIHLYFDHKGLVNIPSDVFSYELNLTELYLESNRLLSLDTQLFQCRSIRILNISDNKIREIPDAIQNLCQLEHLDVCKNKIQLLPETLSNCRKLNYLDASVNPLTTLPKCLFSIISIVDLNLKDTFIEYVTGRFGKLSHLKNLEIRENQLTTLPNSFYRLNLLERLDFGENLLSEMPPVIVSLSNLTELFLDSNSIKILPEDFGFLKNLIFCDLSHNRLRQLPDSIVNCRNLSELFLSFNKLECLPNNFGNLLSINILKIDNNRLTYLPTTIGKLKNLSELDAKHNNITCLNSSIGYLQNLHVLHLDKNNLKLLPEEISGCLNLSILTLRSNKIETLPEDIGRLKMLRVLDLCENKLAYVPISMQKLVNLSAFWISQNQSKPLIKLHVESDDESGDTVLSCFLFPQIENNFSLNGTKDASMLSSNWSQNRGIHSIKFKGKYLDKISKNYPKETKNNYLHLQNASIRKKNSNTSDINDSDESTHVYNDTPNSNCDESFQNLNVNTPKIPKSKICNFVEHVDDHDSKLNCIINTDATSVSKKRVVGRKSIREKNTSIPSSVESFLNDKDNLSDKPVFSLESNSLFSFNDVNIQQNDEYIDYNFGEEIDEAWKNELKSIVPKYTQNVGMHGNFKRNGSFKSALLVNENVGYTQMSNSNHVMKNSKTFHNFGNLSNDTDNTIYLNGNISKHANESYIEATKSSQNSCRESFTSTITKNLYSNSFYSDKERSQYPFSECNPIDLSKTKNQSCPKKFNAFKFTNHPYESNQTEPHYANETVFYKQNPINHYTDSGYEHASSELRISTNSPKSVHVYNQQKYRFKHGTINIEAKNVDNPSQYLFQVNILKTDTFGFSISGGADSSGHPSNSYDKGIFVTNVQINGPADDILKVGDKILKVNGQCLSSKTHSEAAKILKDVSINANFIIERLNSKEV